MILGSLKEAIITAGRNVVLVAFCLNMHIIHNQNKETPKVLFREPRRQDEHNMSSELYYLLKKRGIKCHIEYAFENCRFDAVVVDKEGVIRFIVEVKSLENKKNPRLATKQTAKYEQYNIPFLYLTKWAHIAEAADYIEKQLSQ